MNFKKTTFLAITVIAGLNLFAQNLNTDLQAHFTFDSTLNDVSGNSEHLSTTNTEVYSSGNFTDFAFDFDGSTRLASTNSFDNSAYTSSSISLWFKTSTSSSNPQTLIQGAYMGFGIYIFSTGKVGGFFDPPSSAAIKSTNAVTDGLWHNVIAMNDGTSTYLYLDGLLLGSKTETMDVGNGGSNNKLYFGKTNINANPYTGLINDVRIYNRTLLPCEIAILSDSTQQIQTLTTDLKARFTFDSTLTDNSGNTEDLTAISTSTYSLNSGTDYAFDFDGTQQLVSVNSFDNSTYTSSSVSLWFKTSTLTSTDDQTLLQGAEMGFGVHILPTTGKVGVFFDPAAVASLQSTNSVVDGKWHNVIGINDGTTTYLYLDGSLLGTKVESLNVGNGGSNNKLYLGKTNLNVRPYTGLLNDVRIYDRVLDPCEIFALSQDSTSSPSLRKVSNSLSSVQTSTNLAVYPNPTSDNITIASTEVTINSIQVMNSQGKVISTIENINRDSFKIDLNDQPKGIYFIYVLDSSQKLKSKKVIKL